MWQTLKSTGTWQGEIWNRRKNGEFFAELTTINAIRNRHGSVENYVSISSDITDRAVAHQQELEYRAYHDPLTGLPNQILLRDRLEHAITLAKRTDNQIVIAAFDLDHFSLVNDQYGHATGDNLIERVAHRLQASIRECDTLARIGGDELLLVIEQLENRNEGQQLLERLQQELAQPFELDNATVALTASAGATAFPDDQADADTLIRHATEALHQAKHNGRARLSWFDPEHGRDKSAFSQLLERLQKAMTENELCLHYQPKVNMVTGELLGVESLLRWHDPERGMVPPGEFLPQVEQHRISIDIGNWVLETAISQMETWQARGLSAGISVNINAVHLLEPNFVPSLRRHLRNHPEVNPANLELEILESTAINDIDRAARVIKACRKLGVSVSLDDFGTGFAALDYLKRLPADTLKIDQTFVRGMDEDDKGNLAIIKGIIGLAKAFSFDVIAEGVETADQGATLIELGCLNAQGFGIARPMPADKFESWQQTWEPPAAWQQRKAG
ncbi:MAG: EAL domain-containing protein [Alteromonadaceae bacterium]|nr:EAL domain-containing protein [Alteromonadaceae bacterium]